jgi:ATP-binding cassette subfamily C (CFTR/MRP) protein 1
MRHLSNRKTNAWLISSCVMQVLHYIDLEHEAAPRLKNDPSAEWPQRGHVVFHNVQMRYRPDLPLVLKGLTFEAQPGEKVSWLKR